MEISMKGAWLLHHKDTGEDYICSSLPVVFVIAPQLKDHQNLIYRRGGMENQDYVVKRCPMFRPEDVR